MAEYDGTNPKGASHFPARATAVLAVLWGAALFASIVVASLHLCPGLAGRVILGLIAVGFVFFSIARASIAHVENPPPWCASLLRPRMRAMYWAGYALMFSGVVLTALASLSRWGR